MAPVGNSRCYKTPEKLEIVFHFILLLSPDLLYMLTAPAAERPGVVSTVFSGVVKMS